MKMDFVKMHGCGNDYIYVNGFEVSVDKFKKAELARKLSDRHFGIGSDGLIFINPSGIADFEMEMYNADGTRAEMCGNGIRCVAKYVYDNKMTDKSEFVVESMGKRKLIKVYAEDGLVKNVTVDMGEPILESKRIPVISSEESFIDEPVSIAGKVFHMTAVSMGNPHAVSFYNPDEILLYGQAIETSEIFPNRVNVEFVDVLSQDTVRMRVWERGTGETYCCGTGCCATVVASVLNKKTGRHVKVKVLGGELDINWDAESNHIFMTGPAETVFKGSVEV